MINKLKNLIKNFHFRNNYLRPAIPEDISFIIDELIKGAKNGHFSKTLLLSSEQLQHQMMFLKLINGISTPIKTEHGIQIKNGSIWVYGNSQKPQIGFVYLSEKHQNSSYQDIEILMLGIKSEFRKLGYGSDLIKRIVKDVPFHNSLYVRCFKQSIHMIELLKKNNFKVINVRPSGMHELEFKKHQ